MTTKIKNISTLFFLGLTTFISAQNTTDSIRNEKTIQQVLLTGTRNKNRTVLNSPVPVDVIDVKQVSNQTGQVDLNQLLQFVAPSFNSNQQTGQDESDAVDAATLRGLGPDQTLVLLNGKRYHQTSLVNLFGTRGRGNTGTDLNTIPIAAIKRIEILRDGASAQYGTDAIAGVINVILNDRDHGVVADAYYGGDLFHSPGNHDVVSEKKFDGNTLDLSANLGTKIGSKGGFANVTLEYINKKHYFRVPNSDLYKVYRQKFGGPGTDSFYLFSNIGIPISGSLKFYSQAGYSYRNVRDFAWTRFPDGDNNLPAIYPDGFNPIENSAINDITFDNGVKFKIAKWDIDLYNALGYNKFSIDVNNTLNATLGNSSPTSFYAGNHALIQNVSGFNAVQNFRNVLHGLNVAFGSEFRYEGYTLRKGSEDSYAMYDINGNVVTNSTPDNLFVKNPATGNIRPGGAQGFPGYATDVTKGRNNTAVYVDTDLDVTKDWTVTAAARFEHYNDFGSTVNGKFSTRYQFSPAFAIRGSFSTGFRAPSLAQEYYTLTSTVFQAGQLTTVVLAANNSVLSQAVGIPKLKEEKSVDASGGFTLNKGNFKATVDGYYVRINNRIVLTGYFDRALLLAATGGNLAPDIQLAQFFSNAIDTRTLGLDVILSHHHALGTGTLTETLAGNFNNMKILNIHTAPKLAGLQDIYLSAREKAFIKASAPDSKINLSVNYGIRKFNANLQLTRFSKMTLIGYAGDTDFQIYQPRITTDVSLGYRFTKTISWIVGSANLFNRYPTLQRSEVDAGSTQSGGIFDPVQMGVEGRQLYTRLIFNF